MLVLFSMLSGACACSVAVVKSLNMGNRTHTHTLALAHTARRQCGVWSSIFSEAWRLFGYLKVLSQSVFNIIHEGLLFLFLYLFLLLLLFFWSAIARSSTGALDSATNGRHYHTHTNNGGRENKIDGIFTHTHTWDQQHLGKMSLVWKDLCTSGLKTSSHSCPTAESYQTATGGGRNTGRLLSRFMLFLCLTERHLKGAA